MHNLSNALIELYEAAENAATSEFPRQSIRLMRRLVRFDAALLGMGELLATERSDPLTVQGWTCAPDLSLREECAHRFESDSVTRHLLNGLGEPLHGECASLSDRAKLPSMEDFMQRHSLRQMLLFGSLTGLSRVHWIALFRRDAEAFTQHDSDRLMLLWPHFERCVPLNRARHLERHVRAREARAAALLNWRGFVEAADPCFRALMALEWPGTGTDRVAPEAMQRFRDGQDFEGARIRIALYGQDELIVCKACEKDLLSTLTPAELAVARQFARGLTHKDVALQLGISQHTVRSHIKHVYDKLAINSKAHLVQMMAASRMR